MTDIGTRLANHKSNNCFKGEEGMLKPDERQGSFYDPEGRAGSGLEK